MVDMDLKGKRVLIREDLSVPLKDGEITDDQRIRAAIPTIQAALDAGALVSVAAHLGRPKPGQFDPAFSLAPVAKRLQALIGKPVNLIQDWQTHTGAVPGQVDLWENIRYCEGEKTNDPDLAKRMAKQCDVFIMDAFATAHRAHASTCGLIEQAPVAVAGPLMKAEIDSIQAVLDNPASPVLAIVAGKKVSTKLTLLEALLYKVDQLIVGGGIANTFLAAAGHEMGASLYEEALVPKAKMLLAIAKERGVDMPLPTDVVVATSSDFYGESAEKSIAAVLPTDCILDIGVKTTAQFASMIEKAKTILWNGPVGLFEIPAYASGTKAVATAVAKSAALSIAGGGDTLAAIAQFNVAKDISIISTGGGALLSLIEGVKLPAIKSLEQKNGIKTH